MHTNLYLVDLLDRQRHQDFADQTARTNAVPMSNRTMTRSHIMKRIKQIAAAALVAAALLGAGSQALMAQQDTVPAIASLCCWIRR
jgi:hypothetical protein